MRLWRLAGARHAGGAMTGEGAAMYGGRWNPVGTPAVYTSQSLALATLELVVHLPGALARYVAIELDAPDEALAPVEPGRLGPKWTDDERRTQAVGLAWAGEGTLGLIVPTALVDERAGEHNVVLNPRSPDFSRLTEVQRFDVVLDARLG